MSWVPARARDVDAARKVYRSAKFRDRRRARRAVAVARQDMGLSLREFAERAVAQDSEVWDAIAVAMVEEDPPLAKTDWIMIMELVMMILEMILEYLQNR